VDELEKMLTTLESSQRKLEEAWKTHEEKLLQCLQLRRFEQEFREVSRVGDGEETLSHLATVRQTMLRNNISN
jgi:hypothetical protein